MGAHLKPKTITVGDQQVDIAPLETINFASLVAREPAELQKLLEVSQSPGFFYLDLQDGPTQEMLADLQDVYALAEQYFDQPHELKMKHYREGEARGYEPGEHEETFEIARDEMEQKRLVLPDLFEQRLPLLERFSAQGYFVVRTMLSCLSDALGLDEKSRFENSHREGEPSDCGLKLIYEPLKSKLADVVDNKHTDMGSFTLVFCEQWGVQMELPETKEWAFVEPKPRLALVNVADFLQSLSGRKLYSCLHRVTQPADGFERRYYVVYFLRPEKALVA